MDSDLRAAIRERMDRDKLLREQAGTAWVNSPLGTAQRNQARYDMSFYEGTCAALDWVLGLLDTCPPPPSTRSLSAADKIEAHLALHPEDRALSTRALGDRVGVSKSAVDKWRKLSNGGGR